MISSPKVYIVLGVHNDLSYAKKILREITAQNYKNIEIVVVDDGSSDGTADFIRKEYPDTSLMYGDGNLWWTGCIAKAVDYILPRTKKGDFIFTINVDCSFGKRFIQTLVKCSRENNRAIVGSVAIDAKDKTTILDAGVKISWSKGVFVTCGPKQKHDISTPKNIAWEIDTLTTKGTLYPVEVFETIGNFDAAHLPHYLSDYEFACRAKRAGFRLGISYQAILYNVSSQTGFAEEIPQNLSFHKLKSILFDRKSKRNFPDHFWFITSACPLLLKPLNYMLLFSRSLYISLKVF